MKHILVIADDLSGAAEIAGIGQRHGLATRLVRRPLRDPDAGLAAPAALTVLDTDSRSLPPRDAATRVLEFVRDLRLEQFDLIFKKTDSVLRGPIAAEVQALRGHFGF